MFQFRFSTAIPIAHGLHRLGGLLPGSAPGVPPQITDFANPGLNFRQTYTVTMIKHGVATPIVNSDGSPFYAVPANAGPRTINYADLYAAGTYTDTNQGISVFAGTVDDPFFIDLGAAFDTGNFRLLEGPPGAGVPGVLSPTEDAANANFASDTVSGYAVDVIALQVPIAMLTSTGNVESLNLPVRHHRNLGYDFAAEGHDTPCAQPASPATTTISAASAKCSVWGILSSMSSSSARERRITGACPSP